MALLEVCNVTKRFDDVAAINNVSLSVNAGEFFTLLGPSGCGKTTLLRLIAGFDVPDTGQIILDGEDITHIPSERRPIHTVFQSYALFPHMTVVDNVAFPLKMSGEMPAKIKIRVNEALDNVRLARYGNRFPHELSGGEKQRVALARGLINHPRLLLLDEPLGALDEKLRVEMQRELINLQKETGITFIFITHSQNEALALSHRIAVMNQGNIEQIDVPTQIYNFPVNHFVANFIGRVNSLNARVLAITAENLELEVAGLGVVTVPVCGNVKVGEQGSLVIRPEQVTITHHTELKEIESGFLGKIDDFIYEGDVTTYIVALPTGVYIEALRPNSTLGQAVSFGIGDAVLVNWGYDSGSFLND